MEFEDNFTEEQISILSRYVTNISSNIFVLKNLPEVIKGALFSRYSRSTKGLKSLLLKEFILNKDISFSDFAHIHRNEQMNCELLAMEKAQDFYEKILDGFGDDSIGELGGTHLAVEKVSMLAAKAIEDSRIGGSFLEKSTRYIYFDQKVDGDYQFYKEPILMASSYKDIYLNACRKLFDTYTSLVLPLTEYFEKKFPKEEKISLAAYKAAVRAKVLDCLRGILPASSFTNLGMFGNGRFFDNLLKRLHSHDLFELQEIAKLAYNELSSVIPSFIKRSDAICQNQLDHNEFVSSMKKNLLELSKKHSDFAINKDEKKPGVHLLNFEADSLAKVAAALLFEQSDMSLEKLQQYCRGLNDDEILEIFKAASKYRKNRRQKSPRGLENVFFTFEIIGDFGMYRDLQRHRMLTQERKLLSCNHGYYISQEIENCGLEKEYEKAMEIAKKAYDVISQDFPEEAQYVVPMAYNVHWYIHVNLRALQWMSELRSSPAGHANYRLAVQDMVKQVCSVFAPFEEFFKFVNYEGYDLGRMTQEMRRIEKKQAMEDKQAEVSL